MYNLAGSINLAIGAKTSSCMEHHCVWKMQPAVNALDLATSKINFSANKIAANPSFLSEGNYVNITEQYNGMCFNLNSIAVPESSSLYPSFTESSQYSHFKNGKLSCRKHNCAARSFSAVYVNLRRN